MTLRQTAIVILCSLCWINWAFAHEALDPDTATALAQQITELEVQTQAGPASERALAAQSLGDVVVKVAVVLSDDRNSHGGELSLSSELLLDLLDQRGLGLTLSPATGHYRPNLNPYTKAISLDPESEALADAYHGLIIHQFYRDTETDPFAADPSQTQEIRNRAAEVAVFQERFPNWGTEAQQEELAFIAALRLTNAYRVSRDREDSETFEGTARDALAQFLDRYPDSLRAGAARYLREAAGL